MSYLRMSSPREWTDGERSYAYPNGRAIRIMDGRSDVLYEDWHEITMRILERKDLDEDTMEEVNEALQEHFESVSSTDSVYDEDN